MPPKRYGTWFESDQLPWSDTLEPTIKVLWNMGVSDQPTSSDTVLALKSLIQAGVPIDCGFDDKQLIENSPAVHVGRLFISVRLCGNDIRWGPPFSDFLSAEIPFSLKQRSLLRRLWPQDEMLPTQFGGTDQKCAHLQSVLMGLTRGKSERLVFLFRQVRRDTANQ